VDSACIERLIDVADLQTVAKTVQRLGAATCS
jgi:hypothetical protein